MSKSAEAAKTLKATADRLGWDVTVRGKILTISKQVANRDEFVAADGEYFGILSLLPRSRPGSDWGTDAGGVGGWNIADGGLFVMNRSGGNANILKALAKLS